MDTANAVSILVPILVLVVLWTLVRHWILPFVLGFALAVALGPSARPMVANAWDAVAEAGNAVFGRFRDDEVSPSRDRYPQRRDPDSRYPD